MPTLKEQFWDPIAGFGVTFGSLAMGTAVFLLPKRDGSPDGR